MVADPASARYPSGTARDGMEHYVEPDELAIYGWINPAKPPEKVKGERHRVVALLAIRHGVYHYLDDIWQEWQLAVHQRIHMETSPPVAEREVFTFGIGRNLCRTYSRKDHGMVPILGPTASAEEASTGIREQKLDSRRIDENSGPVNKPPDLPLGSDEWGDGGKLTDCMRRLRPQVQQIVHETYVEGRLSQEVGVRLGLSAENVRQQLRRARDELRQCISARPRQLGGKEWRHANDE